MRKKHRPRQLIRTQEERQSLPALKQALGPLGIQLGVARSGVGKFLLAGDRYLVEAFGDAFVLSRPDHSAIVFWRQSDVVQWIKTKRARMSPRPTWNYQPIHDCAIRFLRYD